MLISNSAVITDANGNVGIGGTPSEKLHVSGGGLLISSGASSFNYNGLVLDRSGTIGRIASGNTAASASQLAFYTANNSGNETEGMRLVGTGNLLIGTTTDDGNRLQVSGSASISSTLVLGNASNNGIINAQYSVRINIDSDNDNTGESFTIGNNQTAIDNNNVLFRVLEAGRTLLNTATDDGSNTLQVKGPASVASSGVDGTYANALTSYYSTNMTEKNLIQSAVSSTASGSGWSFSVSNGGGAATTTEMLRINRDAARLVSGSFGIGFTTVSAKLQVKTTSNTGLEVDAGSSGDDSRLLSYDRTANLPKTMALDGSSVSIKTSSAAGGGTTRFVVDSSGNVAVALATTGNYKFEVNGTAAIYGNLLIVGPTSASSGNGGSVRFRDDTGTIRWISGILGSGGATAYSIYDNVNSISRITVSSVGNVGVGISPSAGQSFAVGKNVTGATTSYGIINNGTVMSDVTNQMIGTYSAINTQAAAFTLAVAHAYYANVAVGATSAITTYTGFNMPAVSGPGTIYGFRSSIASATNNWNLYADGTAKNYLEGNVLIGTTTDSGYKLSVVGGQVRITNAAQTTFFDSSTSTNDNQLAFMLGGSNKAFIGVAGGTGGITSGSAQGDLVFRVNGNKLVVSTDSGSSAALTVSAAGMLAIGGTPQAGVPVTVSTTFQNALDIRTSNASGAFISFANTSTSQGNVVGHYKAASGGGTVLNADALLLRSSNGIAFAPASGTASWQINTSSHVLPIADATYDIGAVSTRVRNVYAGFYRFASASNGIYNGTGSPEGVVTADKGSMYLRTDGGANTTLYIKESGTGNTGWVAK